MPRLLSAVAAVSLALYATLLPVALPHVGAGAAAVSLVPLTLIPWAYGASSGALTAALLAVWHYAAFGLWLPAAARPAAQNLVWLGFPLSLALTGAVAYVRGMHDRLEAQSHALTRAALTDPLTGLANRRALHADLDRVVNDHPGEFILALLDVDGLKRVNDTDGHARGDALLIAFGEALTHAFAGQGRVYRLSGDEFAVLLGAAEPGVVERVVLQVSRTVARTFPGAAASVGVSAHRTGVTSSELLSAADAAMYAHKRRADQVR